MIDVQGFDRCTAVSWRYVSECITKPPREYGREEKSDLEMEYEARLREMDEKHQHELQELENAYQQKIMGEVERYQVIVIDTSRQNLYNSNLPYLMEFHLWYLGC